MCHLAAAHRIRNMKRYVRVVELDCEVRNRKGAESSLMLGSKYFTTLYIALTLNPNNTKYMVSSEPMLCHKLKSVKKGFKERSEKILFTIKGRTPPTDCGTVGEFRG